MPQRRKSFFLVYIRSICSPNYNWKTVLVIFLIWNDGFSDSYVCLSCVPDKFIYLPCAVSFYGDIFKHTEAFSQSVQWLISLICIYSKFTPICGIWNIYLFMILHMMRKYNSQNWISCLCFFWGHHVNKFIKTFLFGSYTPSLRPKKYINIWTVNIRIYKYPF